MTPIPIRKPAGRHDKIVVMPSSELPPNTRAIYTAALDPAHDRGHGKPGEFQPHEAAIILTTDPDTPVHFAVFSRKRAVGAPPVYLELTKPSARTLRSLFRKVEGGLSKREYAIEQSLARIEAFDAAGGFATDAVRVLREVEQLLREAE